ncbi:fumarylacetoacetate hydrolase family protein [Microbulbifer agarilyticus]|uniref:fumarylacetoacetate hydrolase family protein n=1 Tax=Microbulbifer agarilyticus TaxID=260552 RepID=UPI001C97682A|nr:fumarylacetoacetate hydrolase family protein [Microbulbifer agarilyticus]MBY6211285.1 fumarylacetoacetate hydrolase family protein [Microbulbifer agarilyticus]MCA0895020.1 fumarylacetoacetate hydrolase family protein [Microbulbifer agarilyticus]
MRSIGKWFAVGFFVLATGLFSIWVTSPDPQYNPASFEDVPLEMSLAPLEEAVTLAQFHDQEGQTRTMIVLDMKDGAVTGIDLEKLGGSRTNDPFEALAAADISCLRAGQCADLSVSTIDVDELLPSGSSGTLHIGTGTNFPEHAEEANSSSVFQFPKFGPASTARTQVRVNPGILLDYEVELCIRFDRDLTTPQQFDEAVKGIFLCGDFTNRNALINLADPDNLDSGSGFSDSKSGPDFFPTGPFLVIPNDWKAFVSNVRMTTSVNDSNRQDARGSEMTLDFKSLVDKAFSDMKKPRFLYRDGYVKLTSTGTIPSSSTLMSGTAEGTIFTPPSRGDLVEAIVDYVGRGGPLAEDSFLDVARRTFIANELAGKHYLQPGDIVRHGSNYLGDIVVEVVE